MREDTRGCSAGISLNAAGAALMPKVVVDSMRDIISEEELEVDIHISFATPHAPIVPHCSRKRRSGVDATCHVLPLSLRVTCVCKCLHMTLVLSVPVPVPMYVHARMRACSPRVPRECLTDDVCI